MEPERTKVLNCARCGEPLGEKWWTDGYEDWCDACGRTTIARQGWKTRRRRQNATTDR